MLVHDTRRISQKKFPILRSLALETPELKSLSLRKKPPPSRLRGRTQTALGQLGARIEHAWQSTRQGHLDTSVVPRSHGLAGDDICQFRACLEPGPRDGHGAVSAGGAFVAQNGDDATLTDGKGRIVLVDHLGLFCCVSRIL